MRISSPLTHLPSNIVHWFLFALLLKLVLAWVLPITGDEAYFVVWANHPDYGYYDHPPMVAWLINLFLPLGQNELVVRLPAILINLVIAALIYKIILPINPDKAKLACLTYLVFPFSLINVFITTDTPLILFSFLSAFYLLRAKQNPQALNFALSGFFLGLAFFSKYFAVFLGIAYFAIFLVDKNLRQYWRFGLLLLACALPFGLLNLYWNYNHCWNNILFNAINRNKNAQLSLTGPSLYLLMLALMFLPYTYYLFKSAKHWLTNAKQSTIHQFFVILLGLPLTLFFIVSLKKTIGLHWILAFIPFIVLLASITLNKQALIKSLIVYGIFTVILYSFLLISILSPVELFKQTKFYHSIVFGKHIEEIIKPIKSEQSNYYIASDSYSPAAVLAFHLKSNVLVFGRGSHHARQSDLLHDFRKLNGKNILIVSKSIERLQLFQQYFASTGLQRIDLHGVGFYFLKGKSFNYELYRKTILTEIRNSYYKIPELLPYKDCYFFQRYFSKPTHN